MVISSVTFSALAGAVLSLCGSFLPGFSGWLASLKADQRRGVMLLLLLVIALSVTSVTVGQGADWKVALTQALQAFGLALVANQSVFAITPRGGR